MTHVLGRKVASSWVPSAVRLLALLTMAGVTIVVWALFVANSGDRAYEASLNVYGEYWVEVALLSFAVLAWPVLFWDYLDYELRRRNV